MLRKHEISTTDGFPKEKIDGMANGQAKEAVEVLSHASLNERHMSERVMIESRFGCTLHFYWLPRLGRPLEYLFLVETDCMRQTYFGSLSM